MKFNLLVFILSAGLCMAGCTASAQSFIRIYDHHGKKIGKGTFKGYTDSSLVIRLENKLLDTFQVSQIAVIKTKMSFWSYLGIGAGIGGFLALLTALNMNSSIYSDELNDKETKVMLLSFVAGGVMLGGITGATTKRKKFFVHGNLEEWNIVKGELLMLSRK